MPGVDPVSSVDEHAMYLRCVGVPLGAQYLRSDDACNGTADALDTLHGEAEVGDDVGDNIDVVTNGDEFVEPRMNDLHGSALRTAR